MSTFILHNGTPPPYTLAHTHTHAHTPVTENENLIFRGNTFATKAVDTYMKMVGETVSRFPILG